VIDALFEVEEKYRTLARACARPSSRANYDPRRRISGRHTKLRHRNEDETRRKELERV